MDPNNCDLIPISNECHMEYLMVVLSTESCTDHESHNDERQTKITACNNRVKENVKIGDDNFAVVEVWAYDQNSLNGFEDDLNSQSQQFNNLFDPAVASYWNCVNRFLDFSVILNDVNDAKKFYKVFGNFEFPSAEEPLTLSRFYYPAQDKEQPVEPCFDETCTKQMYQAIKSLGFNDFSKRSSFDYKKGNRKIQIIFS